MFEKIKAMQQGKLWAVSMKIFNILTSITAAALTIMVFATVVARYFFKTDIYGSEEIIMLFAWWMYFIGGICGSAEDSHIKADMIDVFCSNQKIVDIFRGIAKAIEAVVFFISTYFAIVLLQTNFVKMPVTTGLKIPFVASQIPLAIGFFGMAVFAVYWAFYFIAKSMSETSECKEEEEV